MRTTRRDLLAMGTRTKGLYVSDECIHGFVDGMCATCNPKPVEAAPVAVKSAPRGRVATAQRPTVRSLRAAARIPLGVSPGDVVLEQRIYHLTHIRNLAAIVESGALSAGIDPVVGLSPAALRDERADFLIGGSSDKPVSDYVPFFLSPDATLWATVRAGDVHPRVSAEAAAADTSEFVFLVSTVRHVSAAGRDFVVADGNSEGTTTRFGVTKEDAERMLYRLRFEADGSGLLDGELLVDATLPLESITLVGVQNDKVRAQVREILDGSDFTPKISVYPPWFQPAE